MYVILFPLVTVQIYYCVYYGCCMFVFEFIIHSCNACTIKICNSRQLACLLT